MKKGDTLYGISNQYGISVTELAELNKVDAKTLQVGQVLNIPSSIPPVEPPVDENPGEEIVTYTVTFKDHDGTVLKTEEVNEGGAATAPETAAAPAAPAAPAHVAPALAAQQDTLKQAE